MARLRTLTFLVVYSLAINQYIKSKFQIKEIAKKC